MQGDEQVILDWRVNLVVSASRRRKAPDAQLALVYMAPEEVLEHRVSAPAHRDGTRATRAGKWAGPHAARDRSRIARGG